MLRGVRLQNLGEIYAKRNEVFRKTLKLGPQSVPKCQYNNLGISAQGIADSWHKELFFQKNLGLKTQG